MTNFIFKILEYLLGLLWPDMLKKIQIRIARLDFKKPSQVESFVEIYHDTFPDDGTNYPVNSILDAADDVQNSRKHVAADNIILIAKFRRKIVGFLACFYYPDKRFALLGYIGKLSAFKDLDNGYISLRLLRKLTSILSKEHNCQLLLFELQRKRDDSKVLLFRSFAKNIGLDMFELDFDYVRPKYHLKDSGEESLRLFIVPLQRRASAVLSKKDTMDILDFLHNYCYGDFYDTGDDEYNEFQSYLRDRLAFYDASIPDQIKVKRK